MSLNCPFYYFLDLHGSVKIFYGTHAVVYKYARIIVACMTHMQRYLPFEVEPLPVELLPVEFSPELTSKII